MDELRDINRLNDEWDALVRGDTARVDPQLAEATMALRDALVVPDPQPTFADRLWRDLMAEDHSVSGATSRRLPRLAIAAAVALVLLAAATITLLWNEPDDAAPIVAIATASSTPATAPAIATEPPATTAPDLTPTSPPPTATPPAETAVATATPTTPTVAPTATVEPDATVPTGPTPPVQAENMPFYDTLARLVDASDLVALVVATDQTATGDDGVALRSFSISRLLRGDAGGDHVLVVDDGRYAAGDEIVLFARHFGDGFIPVSQAGVWPVSDSTIVDLQDGRGQPVILPYDGASVDTLISDIDALPDISSEIDQLVEPYGWKLLGRQGLWQRQLPMADQFANGRVLSFMPLSWEVARLASSRVGLDFATLAGADTDLLVFLAERDMRDPHVRAIRLAVLLYERQIVGAWVALGDDPLAYGLDQRDAVLNEPAEVPTPVPTPTPAMPSGDVVNPAQLYGLADTETFVFCWPYCVDLPQTVALRNSIVGALNVDLSILPLGTHPTPPRPEGLIQSDGSVIWIVFGYLTPGWTSHVFVYDRDAALLLLPNEVGWVAAPPDLIEIMTDIEPAPLPTKP